MRRLGYISILCIMCIGISACGKETNQTAKSFGEKIKLNQEVGIVSLNDLTDFEWEYMYTFEPYTSKEEIEEIVGFQSEDIEDNMLDESTVYLLFTKGDSVLDTIIGSPSSLGYQIDFGTYEEYLCFDVEANYSFEIETDEEIEILKYIKE